MAVELYLGVISLFPLLAQGSSPTQILILLACPSALQEEHWPYATQPSPPTSSSSDGPPSISFPQPISSLSASTTSSSSSSPVLCVCRAISSISRCSKRIRVPGLPHESEEHDVQLRAPGKCMLTSFKCPACVDNECKKLVNEVQQSKVSKRCSHSLPLSPAGL